jgi:hypothetical protein
MAPSIRTSWQHFAEKRRSLADSDHGVFFFFIASENSKTSQFDAPDSFTLAISNSSFSASFELG